MEHDRLTVEKMNPHSEGILEIPLTKGGNYAIITELRGVAQVVARQFRVLEAASSSPATSTNTKGSHLAPFCIGRKGWLRKIASSRKQSSPFNSVGAACCRACSAEFRVPPLRLNKDYNFDTISIEVIVLVFCSKALTCKGFCA